MQIPQIPLLTLEFVKYPMPNRIDFAATFVAKSENTLQLLQELTRARNAFIPLLINNDDPYKLAKAVSDYLEKFVPFANTISTKKELKTVNLLQFHWTSALERDKTIRYMFYSYWFEIAMCNVLLGCANVNCAKRVLTRENIRDRSIEGIEKYHILAATAFLSAKNISMDNWSAKNEARLPVDLRSEILENIAQYFLGQAQIWMVISGFTKEAYSIAGGNAFFVEKCAENIKKALQADIEFMANGDQGLFDFFCVQEIVCYAISCYANALDMQKRIVIEILNADLTLGKILKFAECATQALSILFKEEHFEMYRQHVAGFTQMCKDLHAKYQKEVNESKFQENIPTELPKRQIAKQMLLFQTEETKVTENKYGVDL